MLFIQVSHNMIQYNFSLNMIRVIISNNSSLIWSLWSDKYLWRGISPPRDMRFAHIFDGHFVTNQFRSVYFVGHQDNPGFVGYGRRPAPCYLSSQRIPFTKISTMYVARRGSGCFVQLVRQHGPRSKPLDHIYSDQSTSVPHLGWGAVSDLT